MVRFNTYHTLWLHRPKNIRKVNRIHTELDATPLLYVVSWCITKAVVCNLLSHHSLHCLLLIFNKGSFPIYHMCCFYPVVALEMDETTLAIVVLPFIGSMQDGWIYFNSLPPPSWQDTSSSACPFFVRNNPCFSISPVVRITVIARKYTVYSVGE